MSNQVRQMFSEIAPRYDRANTVLSLGMHHLWRRRAVLESGVKKGDSILDCATGTGDLAFEFKKRTGPEGRVVGSDFCSEMLVHAKEKVRARGIDIEWDVQDAMKLTYPAGTFDVASIAFGIRNVDDPVQALWSMARVVRPGGRVVVLEFGTPGRLTKPFFSLYSRFVIPLFGGMITGRKNAYKYLTRTSAAFPTGDAFLALMERTGAFSSHRTIPLTGGISYLYIGVVR
jgi:demethylmenaquinone methyltransferase / 2-methoxy-6-polyprenyl-1,4-benzoquinol methylase